MVGSVHLNFPVHKGSCGLNSKFCFFRFGVGVQLLFSSFIVALLIPCIVLVSLV